MSISEEVLQESLRRVHERISAAARAAGRAPESVRLLAVSKTFPAATVLAAARAGQRAFGENYVQEGLAKIEQLRAQAAELPLEWHFIGPIQSNKTRPIAEHFDWAHSVERLKVAQRLSEQRPPGLPPLNVLVQVNVSGEASKSGVAPAEVPALAAAIAPLPRLRLRGLMAIPEPEADPVHQRTPFAKLRALLEELRAHLPAHASLDTLSMGMSGDLEAAIAEGAT
ncbi:MAG TPA: YggS family pyridoxal phosphate-dependent enzyme, partial [Burkholderiaceae bacterium]|nr:YggS family pyridoxal phosphate-dependent enzyme [Burkholderiaceae bacterium]